MGLCRLAYQGLDAAGHTLLRLNPRIRDGFDRLFRAPIEAITQFLINLFRRNEHLAIAEERPENAAELLAVPGMGMKTVEKYGAQIYRILNGL